MDTPTNNQRRTDMNKNECQWHNACNTGQCPCETTTINLPSSKEGSEETTHQNLPHIKRGFPWNPQRKFRAKNMINHHTQIPVESATQQTQQNATTQSQQQHKTNTNTGNPFKTGTRKTAKQSKLSGNPHANSDTPEIKKPTTEIFPEHPSKPNCTPAQQQKNKIYN
jgi:hypothetical protein